MQGARSGRHGAAPPRNDHHQHWIKVGNILDCETPDKLEFLIAKVTRDLHVRATDFDREIATSNLRRLHQVIWIEETINYYTERNQSPDSENREKSDLPFDTWMQTRDSRYRDRHFIPERLDHWHVLMLPEFVAHRDKQIFQAMKQLQLSVQA